jgi:hypothetical protein
MNNLLNNLYFIQKGEFIGMFILILDYDESKKIYSILGLPDLETLSIPENDIHSGIENKILDFVEKIPDEYINDCKNEFQYRLKSK